MDCFQRRFHKQFSIKEWKLGISSPERQDLTPEETWRDHRSSLRRLLHFQQRLWEGLPYGVSSEGQIITTREELAGQLSAIISWKLNSIIRNLKIKAKCYSCLRFKMNSEENWDILDEGHKVLWEKKKTLFQMWMLVTLTWHKCACSLTLLPDLPFLGLPRIQHSFFPSRCRGIFLPFSFWPSVCGSPGLTGC